MHTLNTHTHSSINCKEIGEWGGEGGWGTLSDTSELIAGSICPGFVQDDMYLVNCSTICNQLGVAVHHSKPERFVKKVGFQFLFFLFFSLWFLYCVLFSTGMSGSEVLSKVDKGYRMPRPSGGVAGCSDAFYEIVEKCWKRSAEQRPTFAYLHSFFDDYFVNIEPNYQGPDD